MRWGTNDCVGTSSDDYNVNQCYMRDALKQGPGQLPDSDPISDSIQSRTLGGPIEIKPQGLCSRIYEK